MTKRKAGPSTAIGFAEQEDRTTADVRRFAQWVFLQHVHRIERAVLATLAEVRGTRIAGIELADPDENSLGAWATKWHLTDEWCLAHARASYSGRKKLGAARLAWFDRDDLSGVRWSGARHGRRAVRPDVPPHHFAWLVLYQICEQGTMRIAMASPERLQLPTCDQPTVRRAIKRLATLIDLELRPARLEQKRMGK